MSYSTSIVPIVLWSGEAPSHSVSVVTCTYDQKTVITGTSDGQIGLWDLRHVQNDGLKIIPRNLIFAHGDAILDIVCALDASFDRPNIISLAANGEICLWDIEDGLCLQMKVIPGNHKKLHSVQVTKGSVREWRILLYGLYSDIYVLDTSSLEVLYTLKSKLSPDWITCLCTLRQARYQAEEKLVALTESNCLKVWKLKSSYERRNPEVVFEQESKVLDCCKAKFMCCNPFTQRTILVISSKAWQIFDSSDYSFIASIPSPYKQALIGGDFVAANRVIIWDKTGTAYLYRLPSRYLTGSEGVGKSGSSDKTNAPVLTSLFETKNLRVNFGAPMYFSYGRRGPFYKLLFQGTSRGCLHVWKVPDSESADQTLCKELVSASDLANSEATVLNEGIRMTIMTDERLMMRVIPHIAFMSLSELWKETKPKGLIEEIVEDEKVVAVTSSLYLPSQGLIVCGQKNGTIVIINAIKAAITQLLKANNVTKTNCMPLNVLKGHSAKVTCLLYPNEENPRYDICNLVSGSSDFTVRLWDLFNGTLLHTFNSHGGEVVRLLVTPPNCTARFYRAFVCGARSFCGDTRRTRKKDTFTSQSAYIPRRDDKMACERRLHGSRLCRWHCLRLANETGHLDRCVAGSVAYDILESCYEETSSPSAAVREYRHKFRLNTLSMVTQQLPIDIQTPAIVKKMKKKITNIQQHVSAMHKSPSAQVSDYPRQVAATEQLPPIRVCSLRANQNDSDIHVLLLDSEALICQLLLEEANVAATEGKPVNPKRHPNNKAQQLLGLTDNKKKALSLGMQMNKEISHEIAQLLLSCIHGWGIDPSLDTTCIEKLGMMKPRLPVSFGLLTRGKLSLMFPGWKIDAQEDLPSPDNDGQLPKVIASHESSLEPQKLIFNSHWQLSSSLTTQHLVSIVSITNTLMSMNYVSFINKSEADEYGEGDFHEFAQFSQNRAEEKAGWSLVAALHCCLLPEMMRGLMYRPPLLHILARRWQDRCLEIREAAQAILLAELRRVGTKGRKQLIDAWSPHLPQDVDSTDFGYEDLEQYMNNEEEKPVVLTVDEDRTELSTLTSKKMVSSDIKLRHATAIVMLGVIGAEFQKEVDPLLIPKDKRGNPVSESAMDMTTVRNTAKALTSLLLQRSTSKAPAYSAIRRAAIDLIGRGFALWEPHIDVSHVLIGLLDLSSNTELKNIQNSETEIGQTILSAPADLHRSARHALSLIATARPAAYITTLAKEVARHVSSTSSMSFNQTSPAAIAVYSHVRYQPTAAVPDTQNSIIFHSAKAEILRTIELMIDKSQQEVVHLIVEVVDIVVHCLDHKIVKDKGLGEVFPAICRSIYPGYQSLNRKTETKKGKGEEKKGKRKKKGRKGKRKSSVFRLRLWYPGFNMVSYCSNTRRLAVGSRLGHIALYDLRSSRCQLIPAHSSSVTALAFSQEGKILASFSYDDAKISFWQTSSSLLGMLSSTVKCIHSYPTKDLKKCSPASIKQIRLVWIGHRNIVILTGDNRQFKYSV
eukprot:gene9425-10411_t